ncbi:NADPH-dependent FMN reductase [Aureimonas leprariae]|uniref:NAD(P)H-dependent oxidoreductase n=1 Tax=Plantimonas leprariae TaxID=2615207 RepID=A0A7V7PNQ1_9HYPH|nr:NADPH-dependent FMN reductase [Aureimonas leprariae]KAB0679391.1 NAD(P)H-dependent oxidoreductase [Aureimonas leprariae]
MPLNLAVVTVSTRPGRKGPLVAEWFAAHAREHGKFDAAAIDLADFALPVFDEPEHPMKGIYHHEHTKRWSAAIAPADAVAFVMPEYNHGPSPAFTNAVNYLHREWQYKPVGFVTYAGVSGGTRAALMAKPLMVTVKAMPIPEAVAIPAFFEHLGPNGFEPKEPHRNSATQMLDELAKWAGALKPLRG